MRVLGIGDWCDLGSLYLRLQGEGHEVRVHIGQRRAQGILEGLVTRVASIEAGLGWIREAPSEGLILFEHIGDGALHDQLRHEGLRVVGGGSYGCRLENDRNFAYGEWQSLGLNTSRVVHFTSYDDAIAFLAAEQGCWAYKYNGDRFPSSHTYVGQLPDASDAIAVLAHHRDAWRYTDQPSFVLMERVQGVEVGVGAWFDGRDFVPGARCIDFEHKRFFPGDLGELTGEMGTLARYRGAERLFERVLAPMAPRLRGARYQGWINLNTMVNEQGVWPLEFTCRFGYPGYSILEPLQKTSWTDLLLRVTAGEGPPIATRPEWSVGIVLTVPPFPQMRPIADGRTPLPVAFRRVPSEEERKNLHFNEIAQGPGGLVNPGPLGDLMVVTGTHATVGGARRLAQRLAELVVAPDLRWRNDIGRRFEENDGPNLVSWGWLDASMLEHGHAPEADEAVIDASLASVLAVRNARPHPNRSHAPRAR